MIADYYT